MLNGLALPMMLFPAYWPLKALYNTCWGGHAAGGAGDSNQRPSSYQSGASGQVPTFLIITPALRKLDADCVL